MSNAMQVHTLQHTLRYAVRLGEDFVTVEQTVCLPVGATPEQMQKAVDTGTNVFWEQKASIESQIAQIRASVSVAQNGHGRNGGEAVQIREPDAPCSVPQRNFINVLMKDLSWTSEQFAMYAHDQGVVDLVGMTKGEASGLIEQMKGMLANTVQRPVFSSPAPAPAPTPSAQVRRNQPQPAQAGELPF